jgi:hypothetical protein
MKWPNKITTKDGQTVIVCHDQIKVGDIVCEKLTDGSYELFAIDNQNDIDTENQRVVKEIL